MRLVDILPRAIGWVFLLAAVYLLVGARTGYVRTRGTEWYRRRAARALIRSEWTSLSHGRTTLGASPAGVVEFVSYDCPYCRAYQDTLATYLAGTAKGGVTIRYVPSHKYPSSRAAVAAAICATEFNVFTRMHLYLLSDTSWLAKPDWTAIGSEMGIEDPARLHACMTSSETDAAISRDSAWAARMRITQTPTLVARNGGRLVGVVSRDVLRSWLASTGN